MKRLMTIFFACVAASGAGSSAAQTNTSPALSQIQIERFFGFATSATRLALAASQAAAKRELRPEIKDAARTIAEVRVQQLADLAASAQADGLVLTQDLQFEHRVGLENLIPLDYLAFSRRYAEMMVQIVAQEREAYKWAVSSGDQGLADLARQATKHLDAADRSAKAALAAVGP